ncbi:ubiquitin-like protein 7 [Anoplophora glabripennis]|uniref:ubiquitin-like protein 7 n=1 Tax=Anoplophora glabripennis TaxID=217634 RepID=UPI00087461F7|nr:ubiquitin-like protein 7 [Anoplophora glabripennis]
MAASVVLGIWNSNQFQRIKIENVDLESKVEILKMQAIKLLNNSTNIELAFCGVILENENTLSSYGVTPGVTIHVLEKPKPKKTQETKKMTEVEVQQLVSAFRTFTLSSGYRTALQRLYRQDILDKIVTDIPGLSDDPAAVAIIQDPELIIHMADPDTVRKVAEEHPVLIEASNYIISRVQDEQANVSPNQPTTSTGYSYSLEALSDDDDMDSNSDTNVSQHPLTRNSSYNAITAAQLAAAIANATNTQFNTNSAGMPSTPTSNNFITNEMFTNAIQQAFAFGGSNNAGLSPALPSRNDEESLDSITRRLQPQLQQMHEMGFVNDSVNIRALQATSGDVNAAVELVFNGVID